MALTAVAVSWQDKAGVDASDAGKLFCDVVAQGSVLVKGGASCSGAEVVGADVQD